MTCQRQTISQFQQMVAIQSAIWEGGFAKPLITHIHRDKILPPHCPMQNPICCNGDFQLGQPKKGSTNLPPRTRPNCYNLTSKERFLLILAQMNYFKLSSVGIESKPISFILEREFVRDIAGRKQYQSLSDGVDNVEIELVFDQQQPIAAGSNATLATRVDLPGLHLAFLDFHETGSVSSSGNLGLVDYARVRFTEVGVDEMGVGDDGSPLLTDELEVWEGFGWEEEEDFEEDVVGEGVWLHGNRFHRNGSLSLSPSPFVSHL